MNKEILEQNLKKSLEILTEEWKEKETNKYISMLEEKIKSGISEEELKKEFEIEKLKNEIYANHGIDPSKISIKKNFLRDSLEELFNTIHHVVDVMGKNTIKENLKIILDLLILLVLIALIKIPFIFIENMGDSLFEQLESPVVTNIWGFAIDFAYILIAIMVFMNIFTKWFKNLKKTDEMNIETKESQTKTKPQIKIEGTELEGISLTKAEEKEEKES